MKFEVRNRWSGEVQFVAEIEADENTPVSIKLGLAVKWGVKTRANLAGADLTGAYLAGAYLTRANLTRANLTDANLARANLTRANLTDANLAGANLARANLAGAKIRLKNGDDAVLIGKRPVLQIGPIGSRSAMLSAYLTDAGVMVQTGCFGPSPIADFLTTVAKEHGDNKHAQEYRAAVALIEAHAKLWTPEEAKKEAAA